MGYTFKHRSRESKIVISVTSLAFIFILAVIVLLILDLILPISVSQYTDHLIVVIYDSPNTPGRTNAQITAVNTYMKFIEQILIVSLSNETAYSSSNIPLSHIQDDRFTDEKTSFLLLPEIIGLNKDIYWLGNSVIPQKTIYASDLVFQTKIRVYFRFFNGIQLAKIVSQEPLPMNGNIVPSAIINTSRITNTIEGTLIDLISSVDVVYSPQICQSMLLIDDQKANELALAMKPLNREIFFSVSTTESAGNEYKSQILTLFNTIAGIK